MEEASKKVYVLAIEDNVDMEMMYHVTVFSTKEKAKKAMIQRAKTMQDDVNSVYYKFANEKNSENFDIEESECRLYVKTVNDDYYCDMNIIECEVN